MIRHVFLGVFGPLVLIAVLVVVINFIQVHFPKFLPDRLKTWSWVPRPFRTLAWYDEHFFRGIKQSKSYNGNEPKELSTITNHNVENNYAHANKAFYDNNDIDRLSGTSTNL